MSIFFRYYYEATLFHKIYGLSVLKPENFSYCNLYMYEFQKLYQALLRNFMRAFIKRAARNFLRHVRFYGIRGFDKHFIHIKENLSQGKSSECFVLDAFKAAF